MAQGQPAVETGQTVDSGASWRDDDGLYKLLVAEFAGNRGELSLSVDNYSEIAERTGDPAIAERAMRIAIFARDNVAALEAAKLWYAGKPDSKEALRALAVLHIRNNQLQQGVDALYTMVNEFSKDKTAGYREIVAMLGKEKNRVAALEVMQVFMQGPAGQEPLALLPYAELLVLTKKIDQAEQVLQRLLKMEPDNRRAQQVQAQILRAQGKVDEALAYLEALVHRYPDDHASRLVFARQLVNSKRYEDAIREFKHLEQAIAENNEVTFALALVLMQTERYQESAVRFKRLVERSFRKTTAYYYLGQIGELTETLEMALDNYLKVESGQYYIDAQVRASVVLSAQGKLEQAREHLHSLNTRGSADQIRLFQVDAELLKKAGKYKEALAVYARALEEFPENSDLLYAHAMVAEKMDDIAQLEADLHAILKREPNNVQALNALGYTLADKTQRFEEAYQYIKQALDLKPDDYFIQDSMGWVLYRLGRIQEALVYLRKAAEQSGDSEIAAHLGEVLWVSGQHEEAREVWNSALQKMPGDLRLLNVIKRLDIK